MFALPLLVLLAAAPASADDPHVERSDRSARSGRTTTTRPSATTPTRPRPTTVTRHPSTSYAPSRYVPYRSRYTGYYVAPQYRYVYATPLRVSLGFQTRAWSDQWSPPPRTGWIWVSGTWVGGAWYPGYWRPASPPPMYSGVSYEWVPGWWIGDAYVQGYWRPVSRGGWVWVSGRYQPDGAYMPGYWEPRTPGPAGYLWEAGFYDGERWLEGFWRPRTRAGYRWIGARLAADGTWYRGYWEPVEGRAGHVWVPGWFDGTMWVPGSWERADAPAPRWEPFDAPDAGAAPADLVNPPLAVPAG